MNYNSGKPEKINDSWYCPTCEETVAKGVGVCENCGHSFNWEEVDTE